MCYIAPSMPGDPRPHDCDPLLYRLRPIAFAPICFVVVLLLLPSCSLLFSVSSNLQFVKWLHRLLYFRYFLLVDSIPSIILSSFSLVIAIVFFGSLVFRLARHSLGSSLPFISTRDGLLLSPPSNIPPFCHCPYAIYPIIITPSIFIHH